MPLIPIDAILNGDRWALSRLLSQIENQTPTGEDALDALFQHTGKAFLVGITGAPGSGKSTLVNQLVYHFRHPKNDLQPPTVAVVAVDPSSPFSGGAVLGDRVRMQDLSGDPGIFIRSMASRGSLGGIAETTSGMVQALDAAGFDIILIETVGAGQAEVEIARLAHTTVVIEAPGMGDEIQTIKAGILEIADILVVNKADKPEAEITYRSLKNMLYGTQPPPAENDHHSLTSPTQTPPESPNSGDKLGWEIPVLMTTATTGDGVETLSKTILTHHAYLEDTGTLADKEQARLKHELDQRLQSTLMDQWKTSISPTRYQNILDQLVQRQLSPYRAVQRLLERDLKESP